MSYTLYDAADSDFRIYTALVDTQNLKALIGRFLPDQGAIEIQRDVAKKEHVWHRHETDETLVILEGSLRFYWDSGEKICTKGTVISLPAGMLHGSMALEGGATYLIAFHQANISGENNEQPTGYQNTPSKGQVRQIKNCKSPRI